MQLPSGVPANPNCIALPGGPNVATCQANPHVSSMLIYWCPALQHAAASGTHSAFRAPSETREDVHRDESPQDRTTNATVGAPTTSLLHQDLSQAPRSGCRTLIGRTCTASMTPSTQQLMSVPSCLHKPDVHRMLSLIHISEPTRPY